MRVSRCINTHTVCVCVFVRMICLLEMLASSSSEATCVSLFLADEFLFQPSSSKREKRTHAVVRVTSDALLKVCDGVRPRIRVFVCVCRVWSLLLK